MDRVQPLRVGLVFGLVLAALVTARAALPQPAQDAPPPAVDQLVSIGLPQSKLVVQNLEGAGGQPIDMSVDIRRPDGQLAASRSFEDVPGMAHRVVDLAELPELSAGLYAADVRGTGRLAALARHAWPIDDEAENLAISVAEEPSTALRLPYLAISGTQESAILSVQNTDPDLPAEVEIALVPFSADAAEPVWQGRVSLPAGGSAAYDLAGPGFEALGGRFQGYAGIESDRPVTAAGLLVYRARGDGVAAAIGALATSSATTELHSQFSTGFGRSAPSTLAIVNPGPGPAQVELRYHPDSSFRDRCGAEPIVGPDLGLVPGGSAWVAPRSEADLPLPTDCAGLVSLRATTGSILAATIVLGGSGVNGGPEALALPASSAMALDLAMPWLAWGPGRWSHVAALNPGAEPVDAVLHAWGARGESVNHGGPVGQRLEAHAFDSWVLGLSGREESTALAGQILADAPVSVQTGEHTRGDVALYTAFPIDRATNRARVPFLARPPVWPTEPAFLTPAPDPTASPTRVTVVPPPPRAEPTAGAPEGLGQIDVPVREDWISCCSALVWAGARELWGIDFGDGVPLSTSRFDLRSGTRIGALDHGGDITRFAPGPEGEILGLDPGWWPRIERLDARGRGMGIIELPAERDWELSDLAAAPDGSIWLIDNRFLEVHHLSAAGDHLATWSFYEALRHPGDGGYRVELAPDGQGLWILTWTRLLHFGLDGRLQTAIGAPSFELGPEDFEAPMDLAMDAAGRAYVLEGSGRIRVFEPDGWEAARWQTFDRPDDAEDWGIAALAIGPTGQIAVSDLSRNRIHLFGALDDRAAPPIQRGPYKLQLPRLDRGSLR